MGRETSTERRTRAGVRLSGDDTHSLQSRGFDRPGYPWTYRQDPIVSNRIRSDQFRMNPSRWTLQLGRFRFGSMD